MKRLYGQPGLFEPGGEADGSEEFEGIEVKALCRICLKGYQGFEKPPILTRRQRIEIGFVETEPGLWIKLLDACSRQCESKLDKIRENEEK